MLTVAASGSTSPALPATIPANRPRERARRGSALTLCALGLALMGFNTTRIAGWALSDIVFVAAGAMLGVQILSGQMRHLAEPEARRSSPPVFIGAVVLLTAGAVSALGSHNPGNSVMITLRFAWITLAWFWILRAVCRDRGSLATLLRAWRVVTFLNATIAILTHLGFANWTVEHVEQRQTGFFPTPNDLAGLLVVGLPILVLGLPEVPGRRPGKELAVRLAGCGYVMYAISATGSMSALLAAAGGAAAIAWASWFAGGSRRRRRRMHPLTMLAIGAAGVGALFMLATSDLPVTERFDRYSSGDVYVQGSVESRDDRNEAVASRFDELLVVGRGFDGHNRLDPGEAEASSAHNMFMRMIFQVGLPGLLALLAILFFTFRQTVRLLHSLRNDPLRPTCVALLASLVIGNIFAMFQPTEFHRYYWLPIALVGCVWAMRRAELRASPCYRSTGQAA